MRQVPVPVRRYRVHVASYNLKTATYMVFLIKVIRFFVASVNSGN